MNHVRPITILSCLYRLASKVLADQISCRLSTVIPQPVSGGLPGRGVKDLAFLQKLTIEEALQNACNLCGFSLDLVKAFNTFPRLPLGIILRRMGVPAWICDFWIKSLQVLVRHPQHNSSLGPPTPSTTGVPEEDGMSVIAMLCLSTYFFVKISNQQTFPYSYADNLSFFTPETIAFYIAFQKILAITSSLRISIDFNKSWIWATSKNLRKQCQLVELFFPNGNITIPIVSEVKDLGEQVLYKESMNLGFIKDKLKEGEIRIQRIAAIPCALQDKARFIQSTVWPLALYAGDLKFIGFTHFARLRRFGMNALVGNWNNTCPWVLGLVFAKLLTDPFVYVLNSLLRLTRRMYSIDPTKVQSFFQIASTHTSSKAWGPASTFRVYMDKLGWVFQEHGLLSTPDDIFINICTRSDPRLIKIQSSVS